MLFCRLANVRSPRSAWEKTTKRALCASRQKNSAVQEADLPDLALLLLCMLAMIQYLSVGLAILRLNRTVRKSDTSQGVTILRPVCGLEYDLQRTLEFSFDIDFPQYEVLFCAAEYSDPAVPIVQKLIRSFPASRAKLLVGNQRISDNPKLNNLAKGWDASHHDLIVISDSNVVVPPDYLTRLLECWDDQTGFVCSPPIAVDAYGVASSVEAAFLNTFQARWQLVADFLGIGYVQGKTMMFSRRQLCSWGGLQALRTETAEDAAATKIARRHHKQVRLVKEPFPQPLGRRTASEVWQRQTRWAQLRRAAFPAAYSAELLTGSGLPLILFFYLAGTDMTLWTSLPGFLVVWYVPEVLLALAYRWPVSFVLIAAYLIRDGVAPLVWLWGWLANGFIWRGNVMKPA